MSIAHQLMIADDGWRAREGSGAAQNAIAECITRVCVYDSFRSALGEAGRLGCREAGVDLIAPASLASDRKVEVCSKLSMRKASAKTTHGLGEQVLRRVTLLHAALFEAEHHVGVHDGVDAVRHGQNGALLECAADDHFRRRQPLVWPLHSDAHWTALSDSGSMADVASSSIRIFECFNSARAKHMSCRCPAERFAPPSSMCASKPPCMKHQRALQWDSSYAPSLGHVS
jgi:hypothetical protein